MRSTGGEQSIQIPVASYNGWLTNPSTEISSHAFDPSNPDIFWIGTDRGLIRLNVRTLDRRLFTTDDGLSSNEISKVIPTKDVVVVQHPNGVYLYQF